ncbi:hypothetical protein C8Q78DRAFT_671690 [Trametes maxima]|nr:hypothetical protein C8Q78DRAFT_671690 [Trametes maxima]
MTDSNSCHGLPSCDLTSQYNTDQKSSPSTPQRALRAPHTSNQDFSADLFPHFTESELPTQLRWAGESVDGPEVQKAPILQFGFLVRDLKQRILERAEAVNASELARWNDLRQSPEHGDYMFVSAAWSILVEDMHRSVPWLRVIRRLPIGPDDETYGIVALHSNERNDENRLRIFLHSKRASLRAVTKAIKGTLGLPEDTVPLWYFDNMNRVYDRSFNVYDWYPLRSEQGGTRDSARATPVAQKVDK